GGRRRARRRRGTAAIVASTRRRGRRHARARVVPAMRQTIFSPSLTIEIACVGHPWPARITFSSGWAVGSSTMATRSSPRWKTPRAQNEQFPEAMHASRFISISSATARRVTGVTTTEKPKLHWKKSETHGLLPDPEPREIKYTIISVDDHLVEPPTMFEGRLPRRFQELAPKIVETAEGHEVWEFDGQLYFQVGLNAVVGRKREDWKVEPTRFEEMR